MIPEEYRILIHGYLVLFGIGIVTTILHFFTPMTSDMSAGFLVAGIIAFLLLNKKEPFKDLSIFGLMVLTLCAFVPFLWYRYYDTGLYHLQAMRWIIEYPVQFGLANVHYRLGYNSVWFILESIVDRHVIFLNKPFFILNSIILALYFTPIIKLIRKKVWEITDTFYLLTLFPTIGFFTVFLTSASPDMFVMVLTFTVFILVLRECNSPDKNLLFIAVLLSAFAGMVKSSMLLLFVMVIALYLKKYKWERLWIPAVVFIPWLLNGIITSGYLLYPFAITHLPVSWAVPLPIAIKDATDIVLWARASPNKLPVSLEFTALLIIAIILSYLKPHSLRSRKELLIPVIMASIGFTVWVFAPEPRYGLGFIFTVPLLLITYSLISYTKKATTNTILLLVTIAIIQAIFIYGFYLHTNIPFTFPNPIGDQIWNSGLQ